MKDIEENDNAVYSFYKPNKTFVKSAIRVINVLEYFYRDRQPSRAIEISRELDLPTSSTKYLLTSLVESGYLTFNKTDKTYFPSILFSGFASWLAEIYPSGEVLRRLAKDIHQQLGEIITITVLHENNMRALVIEKNSVKTPPAYDFRVRIPLIGSSSGAIALASKPDEEIMEIIKHESRKLAPHIRQTQEDYVLAQIKQVRDKGYSVKTYDFKEDHAMPSSIAVSIPLIMNHNAPPMALGICGSTDNLNGREGELAEKMNAILEQYRDLIQTK